MKYTSLLTIVSIFSVAAVSAPAATTAFDFSHGDFASTSIQAGETTTALNTAAALNPPTWLNVALEGNTGALTNTVSSGPVTLTYNTRNPFAAGDENIFGTDASQQVFREYADDGDNGGGSYFDGDGIGVSLQLSGLTTFLTNNGATSYKLTLFFTTDNAANSFATASVRMGLPGAASATAISLLPVIGIINATTTGDGSFPNATGGGGLRGFGSLSGLTADQITIALPSGNGTVRGSIAGFALTANPVPEPTAAALLALGGLLLGTVRRRC